MSILQFCLYCAGPAVVKPSLVISQPSIRMPVAHTTAILTQPRGISAARPVSVTPGLPGSPAGTELTRLVFLRTVTDLK